MRPIIKLRLFSPCVHPRSLGTPSTPGDDSDESTVAILHRHHGAATVTLANSEDMEAFILKLGGWVIHYFYFFYLYVNFQKDIDSEGGATRYRRYYI